MTIADTIVLFAAFMLLGLSSVDAIATARKLEALEKLLLRQNRDLMRHMADEWIDAPAIKRKLRAIHEDLWRNKVEAQHRDGVRVPNGFNLVSSPVDGTPTEPGWYLARWKVGPGATRTEPVLLRSNANASSVWRAGERCGEMPDGYEFLARLYF